MTFVALVFSILAIYWWQQAHPESGKQVSELWERWVENCWQAVSQKQWGRGFVGTLLVTLGSAIIAAAFVNVISGSNTLVLLVLHVLLLAVALYPIAWDEDITTNDVIRLVSCAVWYAILGVFGLVFTRLLWTRAAHDTWRSEIETMRGWVLWLPARIIVISYALVGNFHTCAQYLLPVIFRAPTAQEAKKLVENGAAEALAPLWDEVSIEEQQIQRAALNRRAMLALIVIFALVSIF